MNFYKFGLRRDTLCHSQLGSGNKLFGNKSETLRKMKYKGSALEPSEYRMHVITGMRVLCFGVILKISSKI